MTPNRVRTWILAAAAAAFVFSSLPASLASADECEGFVEQIFNQPAEVAAQLPVQSRPRKERPRRDPAAEALQARLRKILLSPERILKELDWALGMETHVAIKQSTMKDILERHIAHIRAILREISGLTYSEAYKATYPNSVDSVERAAAEFRSLLRQMSQYSRQVNQQRHFWWSTPVHQLALPHLEFLMKEAEILDSFPALRDLTPHSRRAALISSPFARRVHIQFNRIWPSIEAFSNSVARLAQSNFGANYSNMELSSKFITRIDQLELAVKDINAFSQSEYYKKEYPEVIRELSQLAAPLDSLVQEMQAYRNQHSPFGRYLWSNTPTQQLASDIYGFLLREAAILDTAPSFSASSEGSNVSRLRGSLLGQSVESRENPR